MSDNSNPPLSAPTNTDEQIEAIFDQMNDETYVQLTDDGSTLTPQDTAKAKIARLIALKQREEAKRHRGKFDRWGHTSFKVKTAVKYFDERIAELNTIIEGENHGA